tara:strand:+ start:187 stop:1836 length:1650 start_codon:yes stop_codon:yes gene_type:complete
MHVLSTYVINYKKIKTQVLNFLSQNKGLILPFLSILFFVLLYFTIDFSTQSLIAHDEGLYARRARLVASSDNWFSSPFPTPHHKTLGSYWFIALSIRLFGNSELALRLPSIIASFICLFSLYLIALKIADKKSALICLFSLSSMPLWLQYSRYASPDTTFVLCILLVILFFLEFLESNDNLRQFFYIFLSGLFISTSFFIRSYMTFVPLIGLSPFLFYHLSRKDCIYNILFLCGILVGSIPTIVNLYFSFQKFGILGITSLFDFAKRQAIGDLVSNNFFLIPFNFIYLTFPIGLILLILFTSTKINYMVKYPLLIYCYPFLSLVILLSMSTSYPHYYLFLLPSLSIIFSVFISSNSFRFSFSKLIVKILLLITIIFTSLVLLFFIINYNEIIVEYSYGNSFLVYFVSVLLLLSYILSIKFLFNSRSNGFNVIRFFYSIVITQYFSLSLLFNSGILGNPNYKTKLFLRDDAVSLVARSNTIYLFGVDSKIQTLLMYYLPSSKVVSNVNDITNYKYLITSNIKSLGNPSVRSLFKSIKKVDNQHLLINMSR